MMELVAYTDGACDPNPGYGGWGFLVVHQKTGTSLSVRGGEANTTNNRMELLALVRLFQTFRRPTSVEIRSDSQYVIKSMTEWIANWKRNGWRKAKNNKPIKNQDLLVELDKLVGQHTVKWVWVRGHNGEPGNEYADRLAVDARQALLGCEDPSWSARTEEPPVEIPAATEEG